MYTGALPVATSERTSLTGSDLTNLIDFQACQILSQFRTCVQNSQSWRLGFQLYGGFFDVPRLEKRLEELEQMSQAAGFWDDAEQAKAVLQERSQHQDQLQAIRTLEQELADAGAALELAEDSGDAEFIGEALSASETIEASLSQHEFLLKMCGEHDNSAAILEINGGSGGTEAQDWAEMLLRMYLRWAEAKGFRVEELDYHPGEEAGLKSVTVLIEGQYAYGLLRGEQGVHRLVRISPFDSNARRHTSFASVAVTPDIEEEIEIEIDDKDLRIDTFRSSGAGGQHVNKTDSAVRLTHIPSGIVVSCQSERSQHKNKARAMKVLKSKLYELERAHHSERMEELKGERQRIEFGSQIRNYVMHPYKLAKDLRTEHETASVEAVLDGEIDPFIEAYLLSPHNGTDST